jgi:hypothetical protein
MPQRPLPKAKQGYSLEATMRDQWLQNNANLLQGTPTGQYLRNRIERAYLEGLEGLEDGKRLATERINEATQKWITEQTQ